MEPLILIFLLVLHLQTNKINVAINLVTFFIILILFNIFEVVIILEFILKYWIEVLFGVIFSFLTYFVRIIKNYKKTLDATNKGVIVMLKSNIIEQYNLLIEKKEISIYEKQNIIDMYEVYRKLECCDIIEDLIKKLDNIPIK